MLIADALSRSYRLTTHDAQHDSSEVRALREAHHTDGLSVSPKQVDEFKLRTAQDPEMQLLTSQIQKEWPSSRKECPSPLIPYHESRSERIEENGLVFRGTCLVVPPSLGTNTLKEMHHSLRMNRCLRRTRELLFWPRINAEVKDFVSKCSICQSFQPEQCKEDLQPHEMPSRLWSKLGADLFELGQQNFFILVNYWSSYFEVQEVKWITSTTVITACKVQFARHGIPDVLITDNGTQFSSSEFTKFTEAWKFEHKTSSLHHRQSSRKAENAIKICKNLLKKTRADNRDPLLAFLDWRNMPTEGLGSSPVQCLMGRRKRTLLPTHTKLLKAQLDSEIEAKLAQHKQKQVQQEKSTPTSNPARSSNSNETPWWHKMVSWQLRQDTT